VALLVDVGELAERLRADLARWIDAALVECAGADCVLYVIENCVSFGLAADLSIGPLLEADAHVPESRPPRVLASIAGAPLVFAQLVETHSASFSRYDTPP
jgi:hypothetical protein